MEVPIISTQAFIDKNTNKKIIEPLIKNIDNSLLGVYAYIYILIHFYPFYHFSNEVFEKYIEENIDKVNIN